MKQIKNIKPFDKFYCNEQGQVCYFKIVIKDGKSETRQIFLTLHHPKNKAPFYRICQNNKSYSLTQGKAYLLAYKKFKAGRIAVFLDGNHDNFTPKNVAWGTRKQQSAIHMKSDANFCRVQKMGLTFGASNIQDAINANTKFTHEMRKIVTKLRQRYTPTVIAQRLGMSRKSVYRLTLENI